MSKYNNRVTFVDGIRFDSAAEAARYVTLKTRERAGEIRELQLQPKFVFEINGQPLKSISKRPRPIAYVADFAYIEADKWVVEDVKGVETAVFKLKRALMKHVNDVDVVLVKSGKVRK